MTAPTAGPFPATAAPPPGLSGLSGLSGFDRVVALEPGREATGVRNIPGTLPVFATHFPRQPILPGVLLLESMAALAAAVCGGTPPAEAWRLHGAHGMRFRHFVGPGDQLEIHVRLTERTERSADFRATARVGDRTVATARTLTMTSGEET